jgi:NAD-dependent DNA ligase
VHRYLYYVRGQAIIADTRYDEFESELRELVTFYPALADAAPYSDECPSKTVGSSMCGDYPRGLQHVAESLLVYDPSKYVPKDCRPEPEANGCFNFG